MRQRAHTLYAYPYLSYDRQAKKKVTRLGEDGIGESHYRDVLWPKTRGEILLRTKRRAV